MDARTLTAARGQVTEAKRIYALLGVGANFALIFAGPFIDILTRITQDPTLADPWAVQLRYHAVLFPSRVNQASPRLMAPCGTARTAEG